jgi:hypothetical protein
MILSKKRLFTCFVSSVLFVFTASATTYNATPSTFATLLASLKAGDTLNLASGTYPHLAISGLTGNAAAWITITGPATGTPAVIQGSSCCNTVEIVNSSYVAIKNLRIDSLGIAGLFGLSAKGGTGNLVHHILVEGNTFVGQNGSQQTVGISTKTPTWGWIIRGNTITGAGTGLYLGNSDGTCPFIGGLIEDNLIQNPIGYDAEIKFQVARPTIAGMPTGQSITIIRNNVFIKNDQASPDGNRPNLLVGGFPSSGAGSTDWYEVYGNVFIHNPREALFQASGRVTIHDNVFVDGQYTALRLQSQDLPLEIAYVYNNTIYSTQAGISFGNAAAVDDAVTGNLVFAATPITGSIAHLSNNIVDTLANAVLYVAAPSFTPGLMNFYPLTGKAQGTAIDLSKFAFDTDSLIDFNGTSKTASTGSVSFRGAYAGQGINPGWALQAGIKPLLAGPVVPGSLQCSPSTLTSGAQSSCQVVLTATASGNQTVALTSNNGMVTVPASVTVLSGTTSANFTATAGTVSSSQSATLTASLNSSPATAVVTVNPVTVAALASMTCAPSSLTPGGSSSCTVNLTAAPSVSTDVSISLNSAVLSAPGSVTVPAGAMSAKFTATAGSVSSSQSVILTANLNASTTTATITISPSGGSIFSLKGNATEIPGKVNGTVVTPTTAPAGVTGSLKVKGTGSFAFTPVINTDGVTFGPGGQTNTNTSFMAFPGVQVGSLFNPTHGDMTFYLHSAYSFAERQALPAPNYDYVYDVYDNSQRLFSFYVSTSSGRLAFTYATGGATQTTYYVPIGHEDALFGKGVVAKFRLTWDGTNNVLYLNDAVARGATPYTKAVPNWTSLSLFTFGASAPYAGGFFALRDAVGDFSMN